MNHDYRLIRTITLYSIATDEFIREYNLNEISDEFLLTIVAGKEDDPLLFDPYPLDEKAIDKLNNLLENKISFEPDLFAYFLETYSTE